MDFRFKYDRERKDEYETRGEQRQEKETLSRMRGLGVGLSIPASLVSGPLVGWFLGSWLDRKFETAFWMPLLILLGLGAALAVTIEMLIQLGRKG